MWKGQAGTLLPPSAWQKAGGCSSKGASSSECTSCVLKVVTPAFPRHGRGRPGVWHGKLRRRSEQGISSPAAAQGASTCHQLPDRSCDFGCCITAVEPPDNAELKQLQRGCLWWPGVSLQSQHSPTPLPLCLPAWGDSLMYSFWGCLWVTHLMLMGAKQTFFKSTSWNKMEDRLCGWDF